MRQLRWDKEWLCGKWLMGATFNLCNWTFGIYYENAIRETTILLGPLVFSCGQRRETGAYWPSGHLRSWRTGKLELRLDWSTHQLMFGYSRASRHDHGIYFGPIDLQIEYGKFSAFDTDWFTEDRRRHSFLGTVECWRTLRPDWFANCEISVAEGELDGWSDILDEAFLAVALVAASIPEYVPRLLQVKEKLGELRVYLRRGADTDIDRRIAEIIETLRSTSAQICDRCGKPGQKGSSGGRIAVRCHRCAT